MSHHKSKGLAYDACPSVSLPLVKNMFDPHDFSSDGVTMLPTFMPVATQAAIKGLTAKQVESLGITLILNNTYHLNLRPGIKVLNDIGGAHKFQGWNRNLLTV